MTNPPSTASIHDYRERVVKQRSCIDRLAKRENSGPNSNHLDRTDWHLDRAGWFVLAFASFEAMLNDLLTFHLLENPHLLPHEDRRIPTHHIADASNGLNLLRVCVDVYVRSTASKSVEDHLKIFGDKLTIGKSDQRTNSTGFHRQKRPATESFIRTSTFLTQSLTPPIGISC